MGIMAVLRSQLGAAKSNLVKGTAVAGVVGAVLLTNGIDNTVLRGKIADEIQAKMDSTMAAELAVAEKRITKGQTLPVRIRFTAPTGETVATVDKVAIDSGEKVSYGPYTMEQLIKDTLPSELAPPPSAAIRNLGALPLVWYPDHKYKAFLYDSSASGEVLIAYHELFTAAADYPKTYGHVWRGVFKLESHPDMLAGEETPVADSIAALLGIAKLVGDSK